MSETDANTTAFHRGVRARPGRGKGEDMRTRFISPGGRVETREMDADEARTITTGDEVSAFGRAWFVRIAVVHADFKDDSRSFVQVFLESL
jgi:hypothetical protein